MPIDNQRSPFPLGPSLFTPPNVESEVLSGDIHAGSPLSGYSTHKQIAGVDGFFGNRLATPPANQQLPVKAGVYGHGSGNGVQGESSSSNDSGVWGNNSAGGIGVAGTSDHPEGSGVYGRGGANGVLGDTKSKLHNGVWGDNKGGGTGIAGTSDQPGGTGVFGRGEKFAGYFEGDVEVTGDIRLTNADCAEDFDIGCTVKVDPGTVMVLGDGGALFPSQLAYDKRVAGVVSGAGKYKPGIVLDKQSSENNRQPIALLGKVYCKVDARDAPIEIGDLLTTSASTGYAMKASDPSKAFGSVIGKALCSLRDGQGLIPILIALQ